MRPRITLRPPVTQILDRRSAPFESCIYHWFSSHEAKIEGTPLVFFSQSAFQEVNLHASCALDREVGGLLVGQPGQTPDGDLFCIITGHLTARHTQHGRTYLTFTAQTLVDAHARLERRFPGEQIVGWYHTHPGLSVFLSPLDTWLHKHFFPRSWHVALVIDPVREAGGFFGYQQGHERFLQPWHYQGFFELGDESEQSVVNWANLVPEPIALLRSA